MQLIGIDCATDHRKVGLARGRAVGRGAPILSDVHAPSSDEDLVETLVGWLTCSRSASLLAFDAPLGWPAPLSDGLAGHRAGRAITGEPDELFSRATDRFVRARLGKRPLEVGANFIARTARAALVLLEDLRRRTGRRIPLAWARPVRTHGAIEVYPAATLKALAIDSKGYKANDPAAARRARRRLVDSLGRHVELGAHRDAAIASDHLLDAILCVLSAWHFDRGESLRPPRALNATARREGWIWVRDPDLLEASNR